ncbi:CoA transferase [Pseudomonas sp. UL073]|uniref:CoA transferase n=1 Tax=Zestomonas insulae TaxID=2809017 RepID=A0ABS2IFD2_9GAMM|nr:CoA transferase [Pseudomonas insulae]MBM7061019.1 CoA transferase [Pseudomonas insulae]
MTPAAKPLQGLRILSVEQFGAGPYGTMFLADLGAEVIKIENAAIGGDPARHTGPHLLGDCDSQYFQTWNMNKRSITLDLKSDAGKAQLNDLLAGADALVNNLRGDLPAKLGLDYKSLSADHPALVCLHISAYGRDNDRASWPGYDYLMQAEAGLMDLTGEPEGPPSRFGAPSLVDHMTGITASVGLLAALHRARETGQGCDVDTSLFDVALHQLGYSAIWYLNEQHQVARQARSAHLSVAPVQTFRTADGWIFIMCMTEKFWLALIRILKLGDLKSDHRFTNAKLRKQHQHELTQILDETFSQAATSHWLDKLTGHLPVAPVLTLSEAMENPLLATNSMVNEVQHPHAPKGLKVLANPIKIDGQRLEQKICSALGADNESVLATSSLVETGTAK